MNLEESFSINHWDLLRVRMACLHERKQPLTIIAVLLVFYKTYNCLCDQAILVFIAIFGIECLFIDISFESLRIKFDFILSEANLVLVHKEQNGMASQAKLGLMCCMDSI